MITQQSGSFDELRDELGAGYGRAALLLRQLESSQIVGPYRGPADRDVLATPEELNDLVAAIHAADHGEPSL